MFIMFLQCTTPTSSTLDSPRLYKNKKCSGADGARRTWWPLVSFKSEAYLEVWLKMNKIHVFHLALLTSVDLGANLGMGWVKSSLNLRTRKVVSWIWYKTAIWNFFRCKGLATSLCDLETFRFFFGSRHKNVCARAPLRLRVCVCVCVCEEKLLKCHGELLWKVHKWLPRCTKQHLWCYFQQQKKKHSCDGNGYFK